MEFRCCSVAAMHFSDQISGATNPSVKTSSPGMIQEELIMRSLRRDSQDKDIKSLNELVAIAKNPQHEMTVFANEFLILLAICHTVIPEGDRDDPESE